MARWVSVTVGMALLVAFLFVGIPQTASAGNYCGPGETPEFRFGFAHLKSLLGPTMGEPLECEHANPENGDTLQQTTTGLSFYRKATNTPTFTDGWNHWAWTADGLVTWTGDSVDPPGTATSIAFSSNRDGTNNIYVMDEEGGNVRRLTDDPGRDYDPAWSPDGTQIAFASQRDGDYSGRDQIPLDLYVMDGNGGNVRKLTDNPWGSHEPTWSPDGTRIAFYSDRDGDNDIYVMDADGGNVQQLTDNPGMDYAQLQDYQPAWSPDGARIAFVSSRNWSYDIFTMDVDGGNLRRLTDGQGRDFDPAWSPDGTRIAFYGSRDLDNHIYVMDADGGNVQRLTGESGGY